MASEHNTSDGGKKTEKRDKRILLVFVAGGIFLAIISFVHHVYRQTVFSVGALLLFYWMYVNPWTMRLTFRLSPHWRLDNMRDLPFLITGLAIMASAFLFF